MREAATRIHQEDVSILTAEDRLGVAHWAGATHPDRAGWLAIGPRPTPARMSLWPRAMEPAPFYRPRNPRSTPLWKLSETLYERLRGEWEDRFEARFGFWRGLADEALARYLDCGIPEMGFARLRCDSCRRERLLTFSCRTRQLCPSCGAKRGVTSERFCGRR